MTGVRGRLGESTARGWGGGGNTDCILQRGSGRAGWGVVNPVRITLRLKNYPHKTNFTSSSYGCKTRSLATKEEHKFQEFKKRFFRRIFKPKREVIVGDVARMRNALKKNLKETDYLEDLSVETTQIQNFKKLDV
jgi:hypothetical protein